MKISTKHIILIGLIFIGLFIISLLVLNRIGISYRFGLSRFSDSGVPKEINRISKAKINRIRLKSDKDAGCIEVTPDGVVRVFEVCEAELSQVNRMGDTREILQLFKQISEVDLSKIKDAQTCDTYLLTVSTDSSTRTICLTDISSIYTQSGETGGGVGGKIVSEIIQTIEKIIAEIPIPTPTAIQLY